MPKIIAKHSSAHPHAEKSGPVFNYKILISAFILLLGFFAGLYTGEKGNLLSSVCPLASINGSGTESTKDSYDQGYKTAIDFARKKFDKIGIAQISPLGSMNSFIPNATVKSVSGNKIVIEFDSSRFDILSEGMTTKTITIPDTVKIEKHTPKSQEDVQKAFDEFRKKDEAFRKAVDAGKKVKNLPQPPLAYTVENVNLSDIKAGDIVNIIYEADASKPDIFNAISVELVNNPTKANAN